MHEAPRGGPPSWAHCTSPHASDQADFFVRIIPGSDDLVSKNETLGSCWTSKGIYLDRVYADYHPEALRGIHVLFGKMSVPFFKPGKEQLIFDGDLSPEGIALKYGHDLGKTTRLNLVDGGFWVKENSTASHNLMYGGRASIVQQARENTKITFGGSYYHYTNMDGAEVCYDPEDPFGNTAIEQDDGTYVCADNFHRVEAFAQLDTKLGSLPFSVYVDSVHDTDAVTSGEDAGWLVGFTVGKAKKPGAWQFGHNYKDVEADAIVGAFTDPDFFGGGTDGRGDKVAAAFQSNKCRQFAVTYFHSFQDLNSGATTTASAFRATSSWSSRGPLATQFAAAGHTLCAPST
jgi:hypothetical protein